MIEAGRTLSGYVHSDAITMYPLLISYNMASLCYTTLVCMMMAAFWVVSEWSVT